MWPRGSGEATPGEGAVAAAAEEEEDSLPETWLDSTMLLPLGISKSDH